MNLDNCGSRINSGFSRISEQFRSPWTRLFITLGLLAVLSSQLDMTNIARILGTLDPATATVIIAMNLSLFPLFAKRWQLVASELGMELPFRQLLGAIWAAAFVGQFGPTLLVSEATRFQMLRQQASAAQLVTSQIVDRISGQIVLFALVLLLLPFYSFSTHDWTSKLIAGTAGLVGIASLVVLLTKQRIRSLIGTSGKQAIRILGKRGLTGHYCVSLVIQCLLTMNFCLAAIGLGLVDHLFPLIVLIPPVLAALTLLPITISDWGTREATALLILASSGLNPESIVAISLVYGSCYVVASLPGGLFLVRGELRRKERG
jgi:uncharacterized membrane protein YbhN (UPF0104 family)